MHSWIFISRSLRNLENKWASGQENDLMQNKCERKNTKMLQENHMLEGHEYDPDCKYCCENKFVKATRQSKSCPLSKRYRQFA